ncbi:MAG: hypothetical protein IT341_07500 [Chloroflexi bacterium]|nr:hypothetical protein [Chloroflexota bacterium]
MPTSDATHQMVAAMTAALRPMGFIRRQADGLFTIELAPDVLGWLGLNGATKWHPGAVQVNPVIGVRHQVVERMVAELRGDRFHRYIPPTVSIPIGYVMPERTFTTWLFEPASMVAKAADLAAAVERYGLSAMHVARDLHGLLDKMGQRWGFSHQNVYRRPVIQWLLGDPDGALADAHASVAELGDRDDPAAEELRHYVDELRRMISRKRAP